MNRQKSKKQRRVERRIEARRKAREAEELVGDPQYWAGNLVDKVDGVLTQVRQQFPEDHPLRVLLVRHAAELHAYLGDAPETLPEDEGAAPGKLDARLVLVPQLRETA